MQQGALSPSSLQKMKILELLTKCGLRRGAQSLARLKGSD
jgi:hypothetical protein